MQNSKLDRLLKWSTCLTKSETYDDLLPSKHVNSGIEFEKHPKLHTDLRIRFCMGDPYFRVSYNV